MAFKLMGDDVNVTFNHVLLSFIPLFVAIDVPGVLPIFLSFTDGLPREKRNLLVTEATMTALAVAVIFLFSGRTVFRFLGITESDFRVGGGIVLLLLAIMELVVTSDTNRTPVESVGIVPIGIPLIIGPAVLTTLLILVDTFGYVATLISLALNLAIVWLVFHYAEFISRIVGKTASRAFAKVAALFMVAIAVMMVRVGLTEMIKGRLQ